MPHPIPPAVGALVLLAVTLVSQVCQGSPEFVPCKQRHKQGILELLNASVRENFVNIYLLFGLGVLVTAWSC